MEGRLHGDWGQGGGETGDKAENPGLSTGDSESSSIPRCRAVVFGVLLLVECSRFMDIPSLPLASPQQLGEERGELCKGGEEGR